MRLLLDTHIFLWFINGDEHLTPAVRDVIRDSSNDVYFSSVSIWECIVKHQLGRLPFPESPAGYLPKQRQRHSIASLPLDESSAAELAMLPQLHRDPFDRMLVCQAIHHKLVLVTVDAAIRAYPVTTM